MEGCVGVGVVGKEGRLTGIKRVVVSVVVEF